MTTENTAEMTALNITDSTPLLGEIITWKCRGSVSHSTLTSALRDSGLDASVARELLPRHAFSRAARKLSDQRIIRKLDESDSAIRFQFTREDKRDGEFTYNTETILTLDKTSGRVDCDLESLAVKAQDEVDKALGERTASDISRCVKTLFDRRADLFPIRDEGGAYFVPVRHADFSGMIQSFLGRLNGTMRRFPIPAGTAEGNRSVRESVETGLQSLITEHLAAVDGFDASTRDDTVRRAAERIQTIRYKVEAYSEYLGEQRAVLEQHLRDAKQHLRDKIAAIADAESAAPTLPIAPSPALEPIVEPFVPFVAPAAIPAGWDCIEPEPENTTGWVDQDEIDRSEREAMREWREESATHSAPMTQPLMMLAGGSRGAQSMMFS